MHDMQHKTDFLFRLGYRHNFHLVLSQGTEFGFCLISASSPLFLSFFSICTDMFSFWGWHSLVSFQCEDNMSVLLSSNTFYTGIVILDTGNHRIYFQPLGSTFFLTVKCGSLFRHNWIQDLNFIHKFKRHAVRGNGTPSINIFVSYFSQ